MGWLFYTVLLLCCVSVSADEAQNQAKLNDLSQKLEKVESDRLVRIEISVNLLLEDVYDVKVDQELLKKKIMSRLKEIDGKLGGYEPTNQTGWIKYMLGAHFKDFRPIEIKIDPQVPKVHKDCLAAYKVGWVRSGMYRISPDGQHEIDVVCEQEEHGGGWTVLQHRLDGTMNFHRSWDEYKNGFGHLDGEFWIGNKNINALTENRKQTLRVELQYEGEGFTHVDYNSFWVGNEDSKYKLHVARFAAEDNIAGDSLSYHNEKFFSTKNVDNDNDCDNFANIHRGGWWYDNHTKSNLNGVYGGQSHNGIFWQSWGGFSNSLISVRMMVRGEEDEADKATTSAPTQPTTGTIEPSTSKPQTTAMTTELPTTTVIAGPKNCQDIYNAGGTTSSVYSIYPDGKEEVQVFCEQELQGGGWTVFQRRMDGSVDFYVGWEVYKQGFGSAAGEYWIGNDHLYQLTSNQDAQLLVELKYRGLTAYAQYSNFSIENESENFRLHVAGFSNGQNNPGDSLAYHNGHSFSTRDRDNDGYSGDCAQDRAGAWWYDSCNNSNLNGLYNSHSSDGLTWGTWKSYTISMSAVRMMLKIK